MAWWPWETKREALDRQRDGYERVVAVLREENSTLLRMLQASNARADALTLDFVKSLATAQAPAPQPFVTPPMPQRRTSKDPIEGLGNVFAPVAYDHPDAEFSSERAASLMSVEDENGAVASA